MWLRWRYAQRKNDYTLEASDGTVNLYAVTAMPACVPGKHGSSSVVVTRPRSNPPSRYRSRRQAAIAALRRSSGSPLRITRGWCCDGRWLRLNGTSCCRIGSTTGQVGFEVLTPFNLVNGGAILVNRGWVELADAESVMAPDQAPPSGVMYLPESGFRLGHTFDGEPTWPQPALYLELDAMSDRLGQALAPMVLVLDDTHPAAFVRLWQPTNMPATRHYGYAVQWWGLFLALLVLGLYWRRHQSTDNHI